MNPLDTLILTCIAMLDGLLIGEAIRRWPEVKRSFGRKASSKPKLTVVPQPPTYYGVPGERTANGTVVLGPVSNRELMMRLGGR